jgi:urocanate hydratase
LRRHADAINKHTEKERIFDACAFLLEVSLCSDVMAENHIDFKYNSYVQDIMGPMF